MLGAGGLLRMTSSHCSSPGCVAIESVRRAFCAAMGVLCLVLSLRVAVRSRVRLQKGDGCLNERLKLMPGLMP